MFLFINASPSLRISTSFQQNNSLEVGSSKRIYIYPIFNIDLQFHSVSHLKISATCVLNMSLKTVIKTDRDVYCYVWNENETDARRGASEIASGVFSYLKTLFKENIKSVITEKCSVQNRNICFISIAWLSLKILDFNRITHKYLGRDYTQTILSFPVKGKSMSLFITPELALQSD